MILDCFPYFNEKELLELRIKTLIDYVDGFLITDANLTHRGEPKSFTCVETLKSLGLDEDKIQVLHVELPSFETAPNPWVRERAQRDALSVGLNFLPEDTVFICSDCDEIVNPKVLDELQEFTKQQTDNIVHLNMSFHYGRADMQVVSPSGELFEWQSAFASTVRQLKNAGTLSQMRDAENKVKFGNRDAGWHFSWMGNSDRRLTKLRSIAEYYAWDRPEVQEVCRNFKPDEGSSDMLGRADHLLTSYPHDLLPPELFKLERVKEYLLPSS